MARVLAFPGSVSSGTASNSFETIQTPAGTSPTASSPNDTLTFTSLDGSVTITGNAGTDTIDFSASTGSGRVISSISTDQTLAAAAHTDYAYFVSGTTTVTMPTAVSNTNLYTVKNTGSNTVTIIFTGGQTGDGSSSLALTPNTSLDLLSDNSNYRIV